jgi:hypothetical protein
VIAPPTPRPVAAILGAALAVLLVSGCGSSSVQTDAAAFVRENRTTAARAAGAVKVVDAATARLSSRPSAMQLQGLALAAARARRATVPATEWDVSKNTEGGEEGAEEEDLPRAETEASTAARELRSAMSDLETYARAPSAATLTNYRTEFAHAKELWDESISQLWFLAHEPGPPNV